MFSCSDTDFPPGRRGQPIDLGDISQNKKLYSELEKRNIPFILDEKGFVHYLMDNQAEVFGIVRRIKYGEVLKKEVFETQVIPNDKILRLYEGQFRKAGINYKIITRNGWKEISWSQIDGEKVDLIRENIGKNLKY